MSSSIETTINPLASLHAAPVLDPGLYAWMQERGIAPESQDGQIEMSQVLEALSEHERQLLADTPVAPVEMSPEFTDTARAAIAWVLWHHLGGSSPVGQPLRFALGMGDHDPMPDWRIAEAKRYAELAGATTADFHKGRASAPAAPGIDLEQFRALAEACEDMRAASEECDIGEGLAHEVPFHLWNEFLSKLDAAQQALDASPKGEVHPDDLAVDAFAAAMKAKLAEAHAKGRGGWQNYEPSMQQRLSDMLREHVEKGDPRDVANFCMFLHQRGEGISPKGGSDDSGAMTDLLARWRHNAAIESSPNMAGKARREVWVQCLGELEFALKATSAEVRP